MSSLNAYLRFLVAVVGTALALRLAWALVRPLLPALAVVAAVVGIWQLVHWHRNRW